MFGNSIIRTLMSKQKTMENKEYGYFDDAAREFVITNPATPYPAQLSDMQTPETQ